MKKLIILLLILGLTSSVFGLYRDRGFRNYVYNLTIGNDLTINGDADVVGDFTAGTVTSDAGVSGTTGTFSSTLEALKYNYTDATELTIASGSITITQSAHTVDGEGDAADNLDTIAGGANGDYLILYPASAARNITIRSGEDNILTPTGVDFTIPDNGTAVLYYNGSNWLLTNSGGGFPLGNDVYATWVDNAGTGTVNGWKVDTSDELVAGAVVNVGSSNWGSAAGIQLGNFWVSGSGTLGDENGLILAQGNGTNILVAKDEDDGATGGQNPSIAVNGNITQETYCIRKVVTKADLVDNTATNVFTITTVTGNFGGYKCGMSIMAGDDLETGNANLATMGLDAHFVRAVTSSDAGTNSAVAEISQTASANEGTGAVTNITMTVVETSELVQTIQAQVDVSASGVSDVTIIIELVYWGFATPPVIAGS